MLSVLVPQDLAPLLQQAEVRLSQYKSLQLRMKERGEWDGVDDFVSNLLIDRRVSLAGGSHTPAGAALLKALEGLNVKYKYDIL